MATRGARVQRCRDEGFTLIELLVVVTLIAILAGIAIPVFLSQRTKGHQASITSSLKDAGTVAVGYAAGNHGSFAGLDGDDGTILATSGFKASSGVSVAVSASVEAYCVLATHENLPAGHAWKVATIDVATGAPSHSDECISVPTPPVPGPAPDPEPTEVLPVEPTVEPTTVPPAPTTPPAAPTTPPPAPAPSTPPPAPAPVPTPVASSAPPLPVDLPPIEVPPVDLPPCTPVLRPPLCD